MTQKYLEDSYIKEIETKIKKVDGIFVVLENNIFYPNSGGQPTDEGIIEKEGEQFKVRFAKKIAGDVSLELDKMGLKEGDVVQAKIDWDKRHKLMRYHTASHILASCIYQDTGAMITGNQLNLEKGRVDFNTEKFDRDKFREYEQKSNEIISKGMDVEVQNLKRDEAMKIPSIFRLKDVLPPALNEIRIVKIGEFDTQACGGTHVKNTSEIGSIEITDMENKGANNRRVYFKLKD